MNKLQIILIAMAAATIGFLLAWWMTGGSHRDGAQGTNESRREILYWVAPMDPDYRRDEPGKSPMGMDLVPVYADESGADDDPNQPSLRINPAVVNNIGVRTEPVRRRDLHREIDAVGLVTPDNGRISHVHVRTEGWIEVLHTETEGDRISGGEPLFEIYSPALVSAQEEYLQAVRMGNPSLIRAAGSRLAALGMDDGQLRGLRDRGKPDRLFTVHAPNDGHVLELNVREGMYVQPGNTIMSIADLSRVWVEVDLFEGQVQWVQPGQAASMHLPFATADRTWQGEVDYVYPTIRAETRTGRVRLVFDNRDLALKPNMYARVVIAAEPHPDALVVPTQSIIRTGEEERVILALGDGRFRPAEVTTGLEVDGETEIVAGLAAGEEIVVSSQFLIDSEASVDASLLRMIDDAEPRGHDMNGEMNHAMDHGDMDEAGDGMKHVPDDPGTPDPSADTGEQETDTHPAESGMDHSGHGETTGADEASGDPA